MSRVNLVAVTPDTEVVIGLDNSGLIGITGFFVQVYENDNCVLNKQGLTGVQAYQTIKGYVDPEHKTSGGALALMVADLDPAYVQGQELKHQFVDLRTEEYANG